MLDEDVHYVTLTPWDAPSAYITYLLSGGAILIGICVCFLFYRHTRRVVWLLLALAFFLTPIMKTARCLSLGLPLLPYGEETVEREASTHDGLMTPGLVVTRSYSNWDYNLYLMSIALAFAWFQYRKPDAAQPWIRSRAQRVR